MTKDYDLTMEANGVFNLPFESFWSFVTQKSASAGGKNPPGEETWGQSMGSPRPAGEAGNIPAIPGAFMRTGRSVACINAVLMSATTGLERGKPAMELPGSHGGVGSRDPAYLRPGPGSRSTIAGLAAAQGFWRLRRL